MAHSRTAHPRALGPVQGLGRIPISLFGLAYKKKLDRKKYFFTILYTKLAWLEILAHDPLAHCASTHQAASEAWAGKPLP
jgi:hypothetical protein